jgi:hypothetical protein
MIAIDKFITELRKSGVAVHVRDERLRNSHIYNVMLPDREIVVEYSARQGYGVSQFRKPIAAWEGYGRLPQKVFDTPRKFQDHLSVLGRELAHARPKAKLNGVGSRRVAAALKAAVRTPVAF